MHRIVRIAATILISCMRLSALQAQDSGAADDTKLRHFESKIRPALIQYCQECHSVDTERSGGLLLDSAAGWQQGGDSGPAIVSGAAGSSLLMKAIRYENPKLQMPPDGKLPADVIDAFRTWIEQGAVDPRLSPIANQPNTSRALTVEEAQNHWSYKPIATFRNDANHSTQGSIDQFIEDRLTTEGITAVPVAQPHELIRRLYFDLTGLPPTVSDLERWSRDFSAQRYADLVDHLLASPFYGETVARRWMDIIRYADSITLRGKIHRNAWRYRDYLVSSFNQDRSFQQMIREQVAGDHLPADDNTTRARQLVATAFLAMGDTNLEKQDKLQLDMDYVDEQLDVIGAAFLGQTIGCARCHDHKFDPIPTRDYYALAGILKSSVGMEHANVSDWIEQPLPLDDLHQREFNLLEARHHKLTQQIKVIKKQLDQIANKNPRFIAPAELPGIVVDSDQATLVGSWVESNSVGNIVGGIYLHDKDNEKGQKSATFEPESLPPGEYEVFLAYQSAENRATNVTVKIFSAQGEKETIVNQRVPAPELGLWKSLGRYRYEADGQKYVLVNNANTDGHVIVDAVLFLPVGQLKDGSLAATLKTESVSNNSTDNSEALKQELKQVEAQVGEIQKKLDSRPKYLTVAETGKAEDIPIHIRGDAHTLGEVVPRGFLTAIKLPIEAGAGLNRLHLANWLSDNDNPLTARVYANRVWQWLMGEGIVRTPNNFGTTGAAPSHPELLDWLSRRLIASGWSTKSLVRDIVMSRAYQRALAEPSPIALEKDPDNQLWWRGHLRRLSVESLRDSMLLISGELDDSQGGSLIRTGTKEDYNYVHDSTRRSIYQPVFRNSLPELFDEFDFANPSFSVENRSRSTVAPQGLALMQAPWVNARCKQTALKYASIIRSEGANNGIAKLYLACFARIPMEAEVTACYEYLGLKREELVSSDSADSSTQVDTARLEQLIQVLFSSLDFRFLD